MGDEGAAADTFLLFSTAEVAGLNQCFEGSLEFAGEGFSIQRCLSYRMCNIFYQYFSPGHGFKDLSVYLLLSNKKTSCLMMASDVCYMQLLNCHQIACKKPTFQ